MVCPSAVCVELFVAGRLDEPSLVALEAHIENCEECFLRVAVAAGEVSEQERQSLIALSTSAPRLADYLRSASRAETTVPDEAGADEAAGPRRTIGPYVVTGLLGVGGMSVVYRARHQTSDEEVAVKAVKMPAVASFLARLRQEIEFLREAKHPGIVAVLDSDLMASDPWYAMELHDGPSLRDFNQRLWNLRGSHGLAHAGAQAGALPAAAGGHLPEVLRVFARLCEPVGFIHGAGLVHGDIKPSNVFLRASDQPVLMDFGLASKARGTIGREVLDVTGRIRGTLPYIAPETIRGQLPDARTDLYALGCMLYESVVGQPPFVSRSGSKIIDMHLGQAAQPASERVAGVPPELDELLLRLLAKDPIDRFGHTRALGTTLNAIAEVLVSEGAGTGVVSPAIASEASTPLFRPPLVGREPELDRVLEGVRVAKHAATGAVYLVSGESGIGKTFFAAEVAQRALLAGVQVLTGECTPPVVAAGDKATPAGAPLQPFARFFLALRDRCHERGPDEVLRLFGDRLDLLATYMPALRALQWQNGREPAPVPPAPAPGVAARERVITAVVDTLLAHGSGRPVLLAIDDLQWADDLSLAVLERLDADTLAGTPLVVLGTYRSDEAGAAVQALAGKPWVRDLRLARLARVDIEAIIGGMLSMSAPPEALVGFVHQQAEGIPFFAAEYLRTLVAAGALVYRHGAWATESADLGQWAARLEAPLPRTLHELIRARLQRLPAATREVLEAGAVVGRRFATSVVSRMLERGSAEVASALAGAVAGQILEGEGFDAHTFLHDKLREALYVGLPGARAAQLHLAAAKAMQGEATPPELYGAIGHHLRKGGEFVGAIDFLEQAGAHALAMAASADAERHLRDALELEATLVPRLPALRRARLLRRRGEALQGLGLLAESAEALKTAAALLGRPFPGWAGTFVAKFVREVAQQTWHRLRPRAIKRLPAEEAAINEEIVQVFGRLHPISFYLGRNADLAFSTTVSLNSSEVAGPSAELAVAYTNAAMLAGVIPVQKLADHYFRLANAAHAHSPDPAAESWLVQMEGAYRTWHGKRSRAVDCLERAIALYRQRGILRSCDEAECARIGIDVFAGYHHEVMRRLAAVELQARKRRDLHMQCWVILQRMEAHVIRERHAEGLAEIERARALLPALGRPEQIWSTGFEAYIGLMQRTPDLGEAALDKAMKLIRMGPPVHSHCVNTYDRVAETAVALCARATLAPVFKKRAARARRACATLARAAKIFPIARPAAALHRGTLDILTSRRPIELVMADWRKAAQLARELELPFQELRLVAALLAHTQDESAREVDRQRLGELYTELELPYTGPAAVTEARPERPLRGGVHVEREGQLPLA
jgi:serine/threonine protein kinase/tetratricopeptide (TPR) repeat protein